MKTILDDLTSVKDDNYDKVMNILKPNEAILKAKLLAQTLITLIPRGQIGFINAIDDNVPTKIIIDALSMLKDKTLPDENDNLAWHAYHKKEKIINEIEFLLRLDLLKLL